VQLTNHPTALTSRFFFSRSSGAGSDKLGFKVGSAWDVLVFAVVVEFGARGLLGWGLLVLVLDLDFRVKMG
jgi:hypothetical protein